MGIILSGGSSSNIQLAIIYGFLCVSAKYLKHKIYGLLTLEELRHS